MSQTNNEVLSAAFPQEWAKAEHLLPGYLKKTLADYDQEWMEQWITQTNAAAGLPAAALQSEIGWVRSVQRSLTDESVQFNAQAGWDKLQAGLDIAPPMATLPAKPSKLQKLSSWLAKLLRMQQDRALQWWQKPATGVLASAMIVGQMGLLAATVKQIYVLPTDSAMVTPSSGATRPVDGAVIKVVFKPDASVQDITAALNSVQGRITGGPGALGIWDVEVPTEKLPGALAFLGKSRAVESATQQ